MLELDGQPYHGGGDAPPGNTADDLTPIGVVTRANDESLAGLQIYAIAGVEAAHAIVVADDEAAAGGGANYRLFWNGGYPGAAVRVLPR
jgi:hypothetical protein